MPDGDKVLRTCGATWNNTGDFARLLDFPMVGGSQRDERNFMMHHTDGWMGGGMWL